MVAFENENQIPKSLFENQIPGTLFVIFEEFATELEIKLLCKNSKIEGFRVPGNVKRFAIDVPAGSEKYFLTALRENELVKRVHDNFIQGQKFIPRKRFRRDDEEEKTEKSEPAKKSNRNQQNRGFSFGRRNKKFN